MKPLTQLLAIETLREVLAWTRMDLKGYEEITPDEAMLRARIKHIKEAIEAIKKEEVTR